MYETFFRNLLEDLGEAEDGNDSTTTIVIIVVSVLVAVCLITGGAFYYRHVKNERQIQEFRKTLYENEMDKMAEYVDIAAQAEREKISKVHAMRAEDELNQLRQASGFMPAPMAPTMIIQQPPPPPQPNAYVTVPPPGYNPNTSLPYVPATGSLNHDGTSLYMNSEGQLFKNENDDGKNMYLDQNGVLYQQSRTNNFSKRGGNYRIATTASEYPDSEAPAVPPGHIAIPVVYDRSVIGQKKDNDDDSDQLTSTSSE